MLSVKALTAAALCLLSSAGLTLGQGQANAPTAPGLTFLYSLNCTLGTPLTVGGGPHGNRVVIPIVGGSFSGPRLSGKVLDLGADWGLVDRNGTFSADTRYQLQTDDGAHIFIRTSGPAQSDGRLHLRLVFETGSAEYYWLNNIVAVGILSSGNGYVAIDAWQLESPKS
ncbi:Scytalone dehydratase [Madurella fahalii]|uniref:Scytalone dehydratase n=1 Tax=Madurella fahalii TaxID=1157608 RepID=A0ABQ0GGZ1_9PEZI